MPNTAQWVAAAATFLAAFVALFKDDLRSLWRKPRLRAEVALAAPHCHKTELIVSDAIRGQVARGPCYYLRVWVENTGNERATDVQVFAAGLLRKHADGVFRNENAFLPMNLRWSHSREVFAAGISAQMGRHVDVAHMVSPDFAATVNYSRPDQPAGRTLLCLDVEFPPATRTHLLLPGAYRLQLKIAAANAPPIHETIEVTFSGEWFDQESDMFSSGLGFRPTDKNAG